MEATLSFPNDDKAKAGKGLLETLRSNALDDFERMKNQPNPRFAAVNAPILAILKDLTIEQSGAEVRVQVKAERQVLAVLAGTTLPAVKKVRETAARSQSSNNLMQLAIAMQTYHDIHGHMPQCTHFGADGKPLWSWRVELLPYIEQEAMYQALHQDEPWNSPHNSQVLARMPKTFESPTLGGPRNKTHYALVVGPQAAFHNDPKVKGPRLTQIPDGTAQTILIVETGAAFDWAAPDSDISWPGGPLSPASVCPPGEDSFLVVMFDAEVVSVKRTAKPADFTAAVTPLGGEQLPPNWAGD
jgi:hypothetical protein